MFSDVHTHFHDILVQSYASYRGIRASDPLGQGEHLRAAIALCSALFHFREHLTPIRDHTRAQVAALCPAYDLVGDIVNAVKHGQLTKDKKRTPLIRKADAIYELSVVTQFEDELGIYRDSKNLVVVNSGLGNELDVFELATKVLNFWGSELVVLGVLKSYEDFPIPEAPGVKVVPRIETTEGNFASTIGVGMKMRFRFQVFNKEKGVPVIQDLSKEKLAFRAFAPRPVKLDVWMQNKKTGELKKCQATLPMELSKEYMALPNDVIRNEVALRWLHQVYPQMKICQNEKAIQECRKLHSDRSQPPGLA